MRFEVCLMRFPVCIGECAAAHGDLPGSCARGHACVLNQRAPIASRPLAADAL